MAYVILSWHKERAENRPFATSLFFLGFRLREVDDLRFPGEEVPHAVRGGNGVLKRRIGVSHHEDHAVVGEHLELIGALLVAGDVDGMIIVVRQDLCTQSLLADTMRQLSVVKDKILGFVYNGATSESKKYNKKYYKYGYGYGYGKRHQRSSNDS